ncbi:DNA-processing protein DprA [Cryobacterium sp. 10I1]|uniref:DNA-processing protein DprA n=1 Tax=unclassified Cryobacterium TaxID=2649013 RepID=UPI002AC971D1|nr:MULTISPECIES: DNA-processing protein DprA [unclassified Cryobacterium]MEB0202522.1 DNA-processing protein DprA [Cryobacterium sp. 5I3]MEB0288408.1 DNA-processing protein DprA [Cryobacterium sp. 10S3]MEB0305389.1 DNA-processing protein DprA [Cryobacterium sp. 10I1]WPX14320.1 DNA-processing protein DprA [Cryobacterium sp. 10S3]
MTYTSVVETLSTTTSTSLTRDTAARIIWAALAEPGDPRVGALVAAIGAEPALELLVDGPNSAVVGFGISGLRAQLRACFDRAAAVESIRASAESGYHVLTPSHPDWPVQLEDLRLASPLILWVRGDPAVLSMRSVLVTGDHDSTGYGRHMAIDLASGLGARGYAIVSGAARGIDHAALASAVASGGHPIAVLAGRVNTRFPSDRGALLDDVAESGAVISEVPPGATPIWWQFARRGQLMAAVSSKTIVVEASVSSDALTAAEYAVELGRPLGAVPGSGSDSTVAGYQLLASEFGASVVTSQHDADWL